MLTPKQAASKIGVSVSLIYSALQKGALRGYRFAARGRGRWMVDETEFHAWVERCKAVPEALPEDGDLVYLGGKRS